MIISRAEIRSALAAYKTVKRKSAVKTVSNAAADRFDGSNASAALTAFSQVVGTDPFYRPELVEDLGRRISEGRYFVRSEDIVDRLLGRLIVEAAV